MSSESPGRDMNKGPARPSSGVRVGGDSLEDPLYTPVWEAPGSRMTVQLQRPMPSTP